MTKVYQNKDNRDVLIDLRLVWKEEKRVNRVHKWCIVLYDMDISKVHNCMLWNYGRI